MRPQCRRSCRVRLRPPRRASSRRSAHWRTAGWSRRTRRAAPSNASRHVCQSAPPPPPPPPAIRSAFQSECGEDVSKLKSGDAREVRLRPRPSRAEGVPAKYRPNRRLAAPLHPRRAPRPAQHSLRSRRGTARGCCPAAGMPSSSLCRPARWQHGFRTRLTRLRPARTGLAALFSGGMSCPTSRPAASARREKAQAEESSGDEEERGARSEERKARRQ